jgi:cation transport regulator ChaC
MTTTAVFGYGSLVDPASAGLTLGRPVEVLPARLQGWRRGWTVCRDNHRVEKTFAVEPGGEVPPFILGLSVDPDPNTDPGEGPNGGLIEVSETELERLDLRELRYRRAEVTRDIDAPHVFDRVFVFATRPEHHAPEPPEGAVVLAPYVRAVEAAFEAIGQLDEFRRTTALPPVPVVEPVLVRDQIPPGNPRGW